jgi:hypothetical protein
MECWGTTKSKPAVDFYRPLIAMSKRRERSVPSLSYAKLSSSDALAASETGVGATALSFADGSGGQVRMASAASSRRRLPSHSKSRRKFGCPDGARVYDPQQFRPHDGFRFYAKLRALKLAAGRRPALRSRGVPALTT